ncbi:MAG: phospholipase D-like domain-containing protein [Candidatus Paceibacterota bacterium]|jgi:cardiolipin synthase
MNYSWSFQTSVPKAWEAMLASIEQARESIDLEQYIFEHDSIGEKFAETLIRKAHEGIKIRVLCDTAGSFYMYSSSLPTRMKDAGIEIRFFNHIGLWRIHTIASWFFRDHRKLLIIDGTQSFTGGVGIRDDMAEWRDTSLAITGPIAHEMLGSFEQMWKKAGKKIFFRFKKQKSEYTTWNFITNAPRFQQRRLYHLYIAVIRNARKRIYITTPYFIPDIRMTRVLRLAARRGVDVRIIVPYSSDVAWVDRVSRSYFHTLLQSGIKIYRYLPSFIHTKTAVIDDDWATIGSFNLDSLSFLYNYEGNAVSSDKECVSQLVEHFNNDLTQCEELKKETWNKRSFGQKLMEFISLPLRKIL